MEISYFTDKNAKPNDVLLEQIIGKLYPEWKNTNNYAFKFFSDCREEWNYSKSGWNLRIKNDKRTIIYLMPLLNCFRVSIVFGEKATREAMDSNISDKVKHIIRDAPVYREGRGLRIIVDDHKIASDIRELLQIKKKY